MHCVSSYDSLKTVRDPVHGTGWEKDILGPGYSKGVGPPFAYLDQYKDTKLV